MKLNNSLSKALFRLVMVCFSFFCVKEGPMGATGATAQMGKMALMGRDANETCKACHTSTKVDLISYHISQFPKHEYGEAS